MDCLKNKISENAHGKLVAANIDSLKKILVLTESSLSQCAKLTSAEARKIVYESTKILIQNKFKLASDVQEWTRITTGCPVIDSIIRGGIPVGTITEIVGPSGVGKTQFTLQLALTTQFPICLGGVDKGAVYLCTEDVFPSKRLNQLTKQLPLKYSNLNKVNFEDNIFIDHISDYEQLRRCLYIRLPLLLQHRNIGIIILDSVAGLFRSENVDVNYTNRSQEFIAIAYQLTKLANEYKLAIICVNQVTDNLQSGESEPCLGLAWTNLITNRFSLSRLDNLRQFHVVFAPDLPTVSCKFVIRDVGLVGIDAN